MSLSPETGDLWSVIRTLQERIDRLERVDRAIATSVREPGKFTFLDADGNIVAYIGRHAIGGVSTVGIVVYDPDTGNTIFRTGDTGLGYGVDIQDGAGNALFAPDRPAGSGLSRPYLAMPMVATDYVALRTTMSGTFVGLFKSVAEVQHAGWGVDVAVTADVGTTGEWRLFDTTDGVALGSPRSISAGFSGTDGAAGVFPASSYGEQHVIELQLRRTGGVGSVGIEPLAFYGRQS